MHAHRWLVLCAGALLTAAVMLAAPGEASAQARRTASKIRTGNGTGEIKVNDADRSAATDLGITDIEGRIYKPSVFYMLARSEIAYAGLEVQQEFSGRIVKGALRRPF